MPVSRHQFSPPGHPCGATAAWLDLLCAATLLVGESSSPHREPISRQFWMAAILALLWHTGRVGRSLMPVCLSLMRLSSLDDSAYQWDTGGCLHSRPPLVLCRFRTPGPTPSLQPPGLNSLSRSWPLHIRRLGEALFMSLLPRVVRFIPLDLWLAGFAQWLLRPPSIARLLHAVTGPYLGPVEGSTITHSLSAHHLRLTTFAIPARSLTYALL
ncbi:hypothetical protein NDU88_002191 [Pleurodeles waltl]|uniref:Uncharacterized protein n=1 Tax=Pleurodeles waltl TaxID=8319 RepID=A0AAV7U986_PLEWA|nr:hypothetical protein NDU88_002191 [Pleurodeles waltl]